MIRKKIYAAAFLGIAALGLLGGNVDKAYAAQDEFVVSDTWLPAAEVHDGGDGSSIVRRGNAALPYFDAREKGWITPVKDQGNNESCWSFSSIAAIEANLVKNGKADNSIDLSENQFAYFFYNRQTDRLGYTAGDYNTTAKGDYLAAGGTLQGTGIALATWAGVTTEARSPYMTIPDVSLCYAADYSVRNVYLYNYNVQNLSKSVATIKQAVTDHGAVACGINMQAAYYNMLNASYNCQTTGGNHAVTIVGWDDSYSKDNFNVKPASDGAWIVKNSYGTRFGKDGYFYVSYEDRSITEFIAFEAVTAGEQYDNNYQYDGSANPAYAYNGGEWYANVFQAKGANGYNEELKAVGVYCLTTYCNYEVQIYTGLKDKSKPTSGTKVFDTPVSGMLTDAGYQTISLPSPVSLTAGESFAVLVKLKDSYGNRAYIGVDSSLQSSWITFIANVGENQSFFQVDGKWYDGNEGIPYQDSGRVLKKKANFRIKAYTDVTQTKSKFVLSDKSLGISKGGTYKLSLKTSEDVYRKVEWKSANKNIATVNSNGKIKAKAYGSTIVKATFVAGNKTKTLKCKVTVGPAKVKNYKAQGGKKLKLQWKKGSGVNGYEIFYASSKEGKYKKLATISKAAATSYTKKMKKGTYYVKMRPYKVVNSQKLYGSFSAIKKVSLR